MPTSTLSAPLQRPLSADRTACLRRWQPARRPRDARKAVAAARTGGGGGAASGGSSSSGSRAESTGIPCHYDILELPRSATKEEVKRAFRRLARLWHPDVNRSVQAPERFKAISRAFGVLSDEQQRHQYDESRWGFTGSGGSRPQGAWRAPWSDSGGVERPPPDVHAVLHLDFRQAALGAERTVDVGVMDACWSCSGTGAARGTVASPCSMCKGRREIVKRQRLGPLSPQHHEAGVEQVTVCCPVCVGRGFSVAYPCACCSGTGMARQPRRVVVRVAAGAEDGGKLRLAGEGDVARVGGPRGGLVLEMQVGYEEGMWRQGLDLHSQLAIPLWDAFLGGTATVSTLRGAADLPIPPGTQHGSVLSLAQEGVEQQEDDGGRGVRGAGGRQGQRRPRRGSHHFQVMLQLPREVSREEQALLQRLAELQRQHQGRRGSRRP